MTNEEHMASILDHCYSIVRDDDGTIWNINIAGGERFIQITRPGSDSRIYIGDSSALFFWTRIRLTVTTEIPEPKPSIYSSINKSTYSMLKFNGFSKLKLNEKFDRLYNATKTWGKDQDQKERTTKFNEGLRKVLPNVFDQMLLGDDKK